VTKDIRIGDAKPSPKNARQERQARELRENLIRRKAQTRARSGQQPEPPQPTDKDANGA
jgi:hypothetical protein